MTKHRELMSGIRLGDVVQHRLFSDDCGTVMSVDSGGYVMVRLQDGSRMGAPHAKWVLSCNEETA